VFRERLRVFTQSTGKESSVMSMFYKKDAVIPTVQGTEEEASTRRIRRQAARAVASMAVDSDDCAMLLAALGLQAMEGKEEG
jgi:hypothetical protein